MDISARAISLPDRPQWAIWVTSVRIRREDRSSISFSSSRRPRQVRCFDERQKLPPPRGVKATPPSRPIASDPRLLDRARRDHADRHDLIMRGVGGVAPVDQGARRLGRALRENSTLRTVLIAPSLRLAHSPLEDGRKRPDERSTQPTYFWPARHHRPRRALSAATSAARSAAGPSRARSRWRWPPSAGRY
jgi:hypothetical protein